MDLARLRERGEAFSEEIAREGYLAYSGHRAEPAFEAVYAQYGDLLSTDTLSGAVEHLRDAAPDSEDARSARVIVEWLIESNVSRGLASLDEREVVVENEAVVRIPDGTTIPYQRASIDIANEPDRARRLAIDTARSAVAAAEVSPIRRERLQRERDAVESLGISDGYNSTFERVTGISHSGLAAECRAFLRNTEPMWNEVLRERLRAFGVPFGEATRADALALFRLRDFDDAFPSGAMQREIFRTCEEMQVDPSASGRITFDVENRPGKRSRAFCSPVRVPDEVYLVLRPHGGQSDWSTFLHELGHALHFAYARPTLPFEFRWLGDNSVTEAYAMLFDHRMMDRGWLARYSGIDATRMSRFLRLAGFEELHFLRRYCAKLLYEIDVYGGAAPWDAMPDLYVTTLTDATGFRYSPADAFLDLDPRFYSTRYLRAWQLQAVIAESLVARFDEDWWRNPRTGPFLTGELFGEGQRETATEIATRVGSASLSFDPLVREIERLLES